jgi:hypothetical protein
MPLTQENMQVARCDAPSCKVMRTAPVGEEVQGYFVTTKVVYDGGTHELEAFAHSAQHIGPAVNAVIRSWEESLTESGDEQDSIDGDADDHEGGVESDEVPADEVTVNGSAVAATTAS